MGYDTYAQRTCYKGTYPKIKNENSGVLEE